MSEHRECSASRWNGDKRAQSQQGHIGNQMLVAGSPMWLSDVDSDRIQRIDRYRPTRREESTDHMHTDDFEERFGGLNLQGSELDLSHSFVNGVANAKQGKSVIITITPIGNDGTPIKCERFPFMVKMEPNRYPLSISEVSGGTYLAQFTPTASGIVEFSVSWNGTELRGSPFRVQVQGQKFRYMIGNKSSNEAVLCRVLNSGSTRSSRKASKAPTKRLNKHHHWLPRAEVSRKTAHRGHFQPRKRLPRSSSAEPPKSEKAYQLSDCFRVGRASTPTQSCSYGLNRQSNEDSYVVYY